ncbi:MAG TPA: hypothetical protein VMR95_00945 [Candidatus Binatia bacterium]|nr:hypothetical protein [Candidatus Binatia bacterium]
MAFISAAALSPEHAYEFDTPEPEGFHQIEREVNDNLVLEMKLAQFGHLRWIGYPLTRAMRKEEATLEAALGVPHTEPDHLADKLRLSGEPYVIINHERT